MKRFGQSASGFRGHAFWALLLLLGAGTSQAAAAGPRFVRGSGLWVPPGAAEVWTTSQLWYFTDPGDLSATVTHAQADAMVAAAAAVWNVPTANLSLAQGGQLQEHVSSADTYFNGNAVVFPQDVESSNEAVVPVPVIYDSDGSVTDLLLGSGASDPSSCRENGVIESVDGLQMDGNIHHALLILNGRCVGSTPEQLTQMQYQVMRAFGRILGLAWAQTNDNVFTAATTVTANQEAYWPVMHPLDVICGSYSYQCMPNPFKLRPDDLSSLAYLYPVTAANLRSGKVVSTSGNMQAWGWVNFATGQGMDWVNVTGYLQNSGVTDKWQVVSGVAGYSFQQALSNPVTRVQAVNTGQSGSTYEGYFFIEAVPLYGMSTVFFNGEAINPLYTGAYALAPYVRPPVTPSGSLSTSIAVNAQGGQFQGWLTARNGASSCTPNGDGTEGAPASFNATGWQSGLICGWGHSSWWAASVRAGHSWTLEVTATDETGAASESKLQPVVGVWSASDPTGRLPTLGSQAVPFNSVVPGMTQLHVGAPASDTKLRFVVSDQYGAGRPDFTYAARLLYADSVSPASLSAPGGTITISGTGFQNGDEVLVNGEQAEVQSWGATQIVATAPTRAQAKAPLGIPVRVTVLDAGTGGETTISSGLTYTPVTDLLEEISAPDSVETGETAGTPFAVRVLSADGVTPVAGAQVSFAIDAGAAQVTGCEAADCTVSTGTSGVAQVTVTGEGAGSITLTATDPSDGARVQATIPDTDPVRKVSIASAARYVAAGAGGTWTVQLGATQDGLPATTAAVVWSAGDGLSIGAGEGVTGSSGTASIAVTAANLKPGSTNTVTGCVWTTVCATWTVYGVDPAQWQVVVSQGAGQSVSSEAPLSGVGFTVSDAAAHAIEGAPVVLHQRVLAWEGACPANGRCAAAPVLASSEASEMTDAAGTISFTPEELPGIPQTVQIAASTGTTGFATVTLEVKP